MTDLKYMMIGVFDRRSNKCITSFVTHRFGTPENLTEFLEARFKNYSDEYGIDFMVDEIHDERQRTPLENHTIDHLVQIITFIYHEICKFYKLPSQQVPRDLIM